MTLIITALKYSIITYYYLYIALIITLIWLLLNKKQIQTQSRIIHMVNIPKKHLTTHIMRKQDLSQTKIILITISIIITFVVIRNTTQTYKDFVFLTDPNCKVKAISEYPHKTLVRFTIPKKEKTKINVVEENKDIPTNTLKKYSKYGIKFPPLTTNN